jgi:hypothetical protein
MAGLIESTITAANPWVRIRVKQLDSDDGLAWASHSSALIPRSATAAWVPLKLVVKYGTAATAGMYITFFPASELEPPSGSAGQKESTSPL